MTIMLDGSGLTIEKLVQIARDGEKVDLASDALERIKICRTVRPAANVITLIYKFGHRTFPL